MKKLKIILALAAMWLATATAYTQVIDGRDPEYMENNMYREDAKLLKDRTLLVVVDDSLSPEYSKAMRDGFTNYWTLTKVKFIKAAEVNSYIENEQYAIFTFLIDDVITTFGLPGAGGQGTDKIKENKVIAADAIPQNINDPKYIAKHEKEEKSGYPLSEKRGDYFLFQFIVCGKFGLLKKHDFENLPVCAYEELYVPKPDHTKPVKYFQAMFAPYVIPYVVRFQAGIDAKLSGVKDTYDEDKKKITLYNNNRERTSTYPVLYYNGSKEKIKEKKIYIDSAIVNQKGIDFMAGLLNVDAASITAVDRKTISLAFQNKDPDVLVIDYNNIRPSEISSYYLYATDGKLLAGVGDVRVWYLKSISDYTIKFEN
jgi:hypothetical protein